MMYYLVIQMVVVVKLEYYAAVHKVRYVPVLRAIHHWHQLCPEEPHCGFRALWDRE